MTMKIRIPTFITQDQMIEATKPLFDLLSVSTGEVTGDILILSTPHDSEHQYDIRFEVVVSPDSATEYPAAMRDAGHPQGDEYQMLTHRINVAVI